MNPEEKELIKDELNKINTDMVELHCKLTPNNLSITELQSIQQELNDLAIKYHLLDMSYNELYTSRMEEYLKLKEKHSKKIVYYTPIAILPGIGLIITICLVSRHYNIVAFAKDNIKDLENFSEEVVSNLRIIKEMLERKFILINNKLAILSNDPTNIVKNYDTSQDIVYYDANELIMNYIDNFEFNIDDIEPETKNAMIRLLQMDLKTDCSDLMPLLQKAREIQNNNQLKLVKKQNL